MLCFSLECKKEKILAWRVFRAFHFLIAVPAIFAIVACSGAEDSIPVALPVPFSGSLTADTRVTVADGEPIHQKLSFLKIPGSKTANTPTSSGDQWNLFNSDGSSAGTITYSHLSAFIPIQNSTRFAFTATLNFTNGSEVECGDMTCNDFPYNPEEGVTGSSSNSMARTSGECSGLIRKGSGDFGASIGHACFHRYVYENKVVEGVRLLGAIDQGVWVIQR